MPTPRPTTLEPLTPALFVVGVVHVLLGCAVWWAWHDMHALQEQQPLVWMRPSEFQNRLPGDATSSGLPRAVPVAGSMVPMKSQSPAPSSEKAASEAPVAKATLVVAPPSNAAAVMPGTTTAGTPLFAGAAVAKAAANRSITLRRVLPPAPAAPPPDAVPAPPAKSASLADMARLSTLRPAQPPPPVPPAPDPAAGINMDVVETAVNRAFHTHWIAPPIDAVPESQRSSQLTISISRDGTILSSQMTRPSGSHPLDDSVLAAAAKVRKIDATLPSQFSKESYDLELTFLLHP